MSENTFKRIPGYSDYEVARDGRVQSWAAARVGKPVPWPLRPGLDSYGYPTVSLVADDGVQRSVGVHRLVLLAHVGPMPKSCGVIRHLDGDPANNHLDNLRYGTHSENMLDKLTHGTDMNARKATCPRGHAYRSLSATAARKKRYCPTCNREAQARRRARLRAAS